MSDVEEECRWRLAEAYLRWLALHAPLTRTCNWLAYCRALGLEPTHPPLQEAPL